MKTVHFTVVVACTILCGIVHIYSISLVNITMGSLLLVISITNVKHKIDYVFALRGTVHKLIRLYSQQLTIVLVLPIPI